LFTASRTPARPAKWASALEKVDPPLSVPNPSALLKVDAEKEYESRRVEETFSFAVKAR
jgi:hypothetical protein